MEKYRIRYSRSDTPSYKFIIHERPFTNQHRKRKGEIVLRERLKGILLLGMTNRFVLLLPVYLIKKRSCYNMIKAAIWNME